MRKALIIIGLIIGIAAPINALYAQTTEPSATPEELAILAVLEAQIAEAKVNKPYDPDLADLDLPTEYYTRKILTDTLERYPNLANLQSFKDIAAEQSLYNLTAQVGPNGGVSLSFQTSPDQDFTSTILKSRVDSLPSSSVDPDVAVDAVVDLLQSGTLSSDQAKQLVDSTLDLISETDGGEDTANDIAQNLATALRNANLAQDVADGALDGIKDNDNVTVVITSKSSTTSAASLL